MNNQDWNPIRTGLLIYSVPRMWQKSFDRHVRHLAGITRPQWWLLIILMRDQGGGMTQVDLARQLDVGKVPLGKMLDRLEKVNLISRCPDINDRRSNRVRLSESGRQLIKRMEVVALELSQQVLQGISAEQQRVLNDLLRHMKRNLKALDDRKLAQAPGDSRSRSPRKALRPRRDDHTSSPLRTKTQKN